MRSKGIDPAKLTILQRLALIGNTGRGALEYRPDYSESTRDEILDFDTLASETEKILASDYDGEFLDTLYAHGGTSGGARPKVFVKIDDKEWLVKFRATMDPMNVGEIEYKYSLLAKKCSINMTETRLFEGKYFGVERFDRTPAYDLLPSNGFNGFHTTTINNNGEPTISDVMAVADRVGLNKTRSAEIIEEIRMTVPISG